MKPDHDWAAPTPTKVFVGSKMETVDKQAFRAICEPEGIEVLAVKAAEDAIPQLSLVKDDNGINLGIRESAATSPKDAQNILQRLKSAK